MVVLEFTWSKVQKQRLVELNADESLLQYTFQDAKKRDRAFQSLDKELVLANKKHLIDLRNKELRPLLCQLESQLVQCLTQEGFVQVVTPHLLPRDMLERMTITSEHPLSNQVFWVDRNKCLRPMMYQE